MIKRIFPAIVPFLFLVGCGPDNPYQVDTSDTGRVEVEIKRLEKDLHEANPDSAHRIIPRFNKKYGDVFASNLCQ